MEKLIEVDGQKVPFKATASTTRRYRQKFGRDLLVDMQNLINGIASPDSLSVELLEAFENVAYIMAKQADPTIPEDPDDWLDSFEMMSIYEILPELIALWGLNMETLEDTKKKAEEQSGE